MDLKKLREEERKQENGLRRQKMVDAAFVCFCRNGIEKASFAKIAREAGFGEATMYRYFSNKENLALECGIKFWRMVQDFFEERTVDPAYGKMSGLEQTRELMHGALAFFKQNRDAFWLIHNLDGYLLSHPVDSEKLGEYEQAVDGLRPVLCDALMRGKADGSIGRTEEIQELYYALATGIFSIMQKQAASGLLLTSDLDVEQEKKMEIFVELLLEGLKGR